MTRALSFFFFFLIYLCTSQGTSIFLLKSSTRQGIFERESKGAGGAVVDVADRGMKYKHKPED